MNNIQAVVALLTPIAALIAMMVGVVTLINEIVKLWSRLQTGNRRVLIFITQIIPVGSIIWYFLYFAASYSERLTERGFFLLLVIYPTLLICAYEIFWGTWLFPRLHSDTQLTRSTQNSSKFIRRNVRRS